MGVDALVKKVLKDVGIREERYSLQWASAAEAPRFVQLITRFTQQVKELGPIGQAEGLSQEELKARIDKALAAVSDQKVGSPLATPLRQCVRMESGPMSISAESSMKRWRNRWLVPLADTV